MNRSKLFMVVSLYTAMIAACAPSFADTSVAIGSDVYAQLQHENAQIQATLKFSDKTDKCLSADSWGWGAEGKCPERTISALSVSLSGKKVYIPISSFSNLGNPHKIQIEDYRNDGDMNFTITGGDAATAYIAKFEVNHGKLSKRTILSGEFPEDVTEETVYHTLPEN